MMELQATKLCVLYDKHNYVFVHCMQAALLKEYPNKMLVTVTQSVFSTAQLFVVAAVAERNFSKWKLGLDISLLAVLYTVIIIYCTSYESTTSIQKIKVMGNSLQ